jgi:hypothetical protein
MAPSITSMDEALTLVKGAIADAGLTAKVRRLFDIDIGSIDILRMRFDIDLRWVFTT